MGNGLDAIGNFFKAVNNTAQDISNGSFDPKKVVKRQGYLSNGQPNSILDPNIAASANSHRTAAGDF